MKKEEYSRKSYYIELDGSEVFRMDAYSNGEVTLTEDSWKMTVGDIPDIASQLRWLADELEKDFPQGKGEETN